MWHPILADQECYERIASALTELEATLYQQDLMCFDSDQEKISQIELAIEILKGNRNDLIKIT